MQFEEEEVAVAVPTATDDDNEVRHTSSFEAQGFDSPYLKIGGIRWHFINSLVSTAARLSTETQGSAPHAQATVLSATFARHACARSIKIRPSARDAEGSYTFPVPIAASALLYRINANNAAQA